VHLPKGGRDASGFQEKRKDRMLRSRFCGKKEKGHIHGRRRKKKKVFGYREKRRGERGQRFFVVRESKKEKPCVILPSWEKKDEGLFESGEGGRGERNEKGT